MNKPLMIRLTGLELGSYPETRDLRKAAMLFADKNLIGKTFANRSSGHPIRVTRQGMKHGLLGANPLEIQLTPALAQMLELAIHKESVPDRLGRLHIKASHKYLVELQVGTEEVAVGIVTHEKAGGIEHYDHFVVKTK